MKYTEFDRFTVKEVEKIIGHDIFKAIELFADSYVATYRIAHDVSELKVAIEKQRDELRQSLDLCIKCLKLIETIVQNR